MTRIACYGGSFNPVHMGHIRSAAHTMAELSLDRLYFMPNAAPPHKKALYLDYDIRVKLLSLAIADAGDARMEISSIESDPARKHFTHGTLTRLRELHKDDELFFIMGLDSLLQLHTWKNWMQLVELASIAVLVRPGYDLAQMPAAVRDHVNSVRKQHLNGKRDTTFIYVNNSCEDISSTELRELLSREREQLTSLELAKLNNFISPSELQAIRELRLFAPQSR